MEESDDGYDVQTDIENSQEDSEAGVIDVVSQEEFLTESSEFEDLPTTEDEDLSDKSKFHLLVLKF